MTGKFTVAVVGFSSFERASLETCFRLSLGRIPCYEPGAAVTKADLLVVDADDPGAMATVSANGRLGRAVCIGANAPARAGARLPRPIDPMHVWRELDRLSAMLVLDAAPCVGSALGTPPAAVHDKAERAARRRAAAAPAAQDLADVLMVDDSDVALRHLERQLHALGLKTQRALHSRDALERAATQAFSAWFIDVHLGESSELDGLGLCHLLRQQRRSNSAPALFLLSAHNAPADRVRGSLAGCDAYLAKPLEEARLRETLDRHGLLPAPPAAAPSATPTPFKPAVRASAR